MKIKILQKYLAAGTFQYLIVNEDTGQKLALADQPNMSDAQAIALAEKSWAAEVMAVKPIEPAKNIQSLSDADLITEVKKRPQITAKALGLSVEPVEKVKP